MTRAAARVLHPAIALPAAIALGLVLRLAPCMRDPGFEFVVDAAYHARLAMQAATTGQLAPVDVMSEAPTGRRTADHLPTALETLGGVALRAAGAVRAAHVDDPRRAESGAFRADHARGADARDTLLRADLERGTGAAGVARRAAVAAPAPMAPVRGGDPGRWPLAWLIALSGALVALPVWLGARAAGAGPRIASLASLASVALPAHLQRTHGFYFRADGPGTLLLATHLALLLASLADVRPWARRACALGAALALAAALATWRVGVVLLEAELAAALAWLLARGANAALRELWLVLALAGTFALLPVTYLARHGFLVSPSWIGVVALAVVAWLPIARESARRPARAIAALLVVAAVAAAAFAGRAGGADYAGVGAMLRARLGGARDAAGSLLLGVTELRASTPAELLAGSRTFFVLGAWLVAAPFVAWWAHGASARAKLAAIDAAPATLAIATALLVVATLFAERTSVLLAPLLAMSLGALAATLWRAGEAGTSAPSPRTAVTASASRGGTAKRGRARAEAPRGQAFAAPRVVALLLALSALGTAGFGVRESSSAWSSLDRSLAASIDWLRAHASQGDVVACDWDAGYDVQARAGLATATDGFLESTTNRARIARLDEAFLAPDAAPLLAACREWHARWILVPSGAAIWSMAVVAGDPLADALARGESITPGPMTNHVIVHLIEGDIAYPGLRGAFEAGPFTVIEVEPAAK